MDFTLKHEMARPPAAIRKCKLVIARTAGVGYAIGRPIRSYLGYWLSGEDTRAPATPGRATCS